MKGSPVPRELQVNRELSSLTTPETALWSYQNITKIRPVDIISRGERTPQVFSYGTSILEGRFEAEDGSSLELVDLVKNIGANGFLAIKNGKIAAEIYRNGFAPTKRHMAFSVTKSLVGLLTGILIDDGLFDPTQPIVNYLPELDASGYRDATLRQVMDMTTSVEWNHNRDDPLASVNVNSVSGGFTTGPHEIKFENTLEFILSLGSAETHGEVFTYNPANTEILGWIIERATGRAWQEVFSDRIWSRIGSERDALVAVDRGGHGFATAGFSSTLRDFGRIGVMLANGGEINGNRIVSENWVQDIYSPDRGSVSAMNKSNEAGLLGPGSFYRNQFRVADAERGEFMAIGFGGQSIYVDREAEFAGVILSSLPGQTTEPAHLKLMRQIARL